MTSGFDLFGIPENPTINLGFAKLTGDLIAVNGENGVPDPVAEPVQCYTYLRNKSDLMTLSAQQRPMVRLADKNLNVVAELTGELMGDVEELMSDSGQARIVASVDNWLVDWIVNGSRVDEDIHLIVDPTPTNRSWRTRWGGKIHQVNIKRNEDGTSTCEIMAVSHREHAKKLLFAAAPELPPEFQFPKMWIMPGPIRTALFITMVVNLARIFEPGLSILANVANPGSWISTGQALSPLNYPIQVAFVNPLIDQSRWTVVGATWTDWHSSTQDMLKDTGVVLRAYTWLNEDVDSPHTELVDLITGSAQAVESLLEMLGLTDAAQLVELLAGAESYVLARPARNCVVFGLEDLGGYAGPTGTVLDGLLNLIGVTLDDLITTIVVDQDTGQTLDGEPVVDVINPATPVFETLLGVAPRAPSVIWRDSQYDRVSSKQHTLYKAPILTVVTGGHSPSILNEAIQFGIKFGLSQIQVAVGDATSVGAGPAEFATVTGDEGVDFGPAPIGSGLEELYQGHLSDIALAWEKWSDPGRAVWSGDLKYQEFVERGSQTAYTLSSVLTLRTGNWNSRSYYGFQAQVISGFPWVLDVDITLGERGGWEFDDVIYVDQVTALRRTWDRDTPVLCQLSIGDDADKQDPIARSMRAINAIFGLFGAILGEGTLFG